MNEGRNFIIATVDTGGSEIAAVNVHVPYLEKEETSLRQLMRELVDVRLPVVLMGDFNLKPEEKTLDDPGKKRLQPVLDQFLDTAVEAETKSAESVCLTSYARKLVTAISSGVFDLFDPVLERHSFDELGEVV
jgi:endonuclease/exonuclease/phosphatase family metal-dependent hydrolase